MKPHGHNPKARREARQRELQMRREEKQAERLERRRSAPADQPATAD